MDPLLLLLFTQRFFFKLNRERHAAAEVDYQEFAIEEEEQEMI